MDWKSLFFIGKMAIEIVDLPINSMVIVHSYVSLPEGILDDCEILHQFS